MSRYFFPGFQGDKDDILEWSCTDDEASEEIDVVKRVRPSRAGGESDFHHFIANVPPAIRSRSVGDDPDCETAAYSYDPPLLRGLGLLFPTNGISQFDERIYSAPVMVNPHLFDASADVDVPLPVDDLAAGVLDLCVKVIDEATQHYLRRRNSSRQQPGGSVHASVQGRAPSPNTAARPHTFAAAQPVPGQDPRIAVVHTHGGGAAFQSNYLAPSGPAVGGVPGSPTVARPAGQAPRAMPTHPHPVVMSSAAVRPPDAAALALQTRPPSNTGVISAAGYAVDAPQQVHHAGQVHQQRPSSPTTGPGAVHPGTHPGPRGPFQGPPAGRASSPSSTHVPVRPMGGVSSPTGWNPTPSAGRTAAPAPNGRGLGAVGAPHYRAGTTFSPATGAAGAPFNQYPIPALSRGGQGAPLAAAHASASPATALSPAVQSRITQGGGTALPAAGQPFGGHAAAFQRATITSPARPVTAAGRGNGMQPANPGAPVGAAAPPGPGAVSGLGPAGAYPRTNPNAPVAGPGQRFA